MILGVDTTHLLMASEDSDVVGIEGHTTNSSRSAEIDMCILRTKCKIQ